MLQVLRRVDRLACGTAVARGLSVVTRDVLTLRFSRSSGPGGQHVNKVNTKVDARFVLRDAAWLTEHEREGIATSQARRINARGEVFVTSQRHRSQAQNIDDCVRKLQVIVDRASASSLPAPSSGTTVVDEGVLDGNITGGACGGGSSRRGAAGGRGGTGDVQFSKEAVQRARARKRRGRGGAGVKAYLRAKAARGARVVASSEEQERQKQAQQPQQGKRGAKVGKPVRVKKGKQTMWRWQ
eukprot:g6584.t1